MRRRVGGFRFRFGALLEPEDDDDDEAGEEGEGEGLAGVLVDGVEEDIFALEERWGDEDCLLFGRSIHGFSGGVSGTVYCFKAVPDKSHFLGVQTPTSTRQAATSLFADS